MKDFEKKIKKILEEASKEGVSYMLVASNPINNKKRESILSYNFNDAQSLGDTLCEYMIQNEKLKDFITTASASVIFKDMVDGLKKRKPQSMNDDEEEEIKDDENDEDLDEEEGDEEEGETKVATKADVDKAFNECMTELDELLDLLESMKPVLNKFHKGIK